MIVSINENWKIPIGYFLASNLNSSQKAELIRHALNLLKETGVKIVSLTFDGCSTNVTMAKLLGCNFNIKTLNTKFIAQTTNNVDVEVAVFLDPAHMVKLVRNAFGEKKLFKDCDGNIINFNFIERLFILQEEEGAHLANKLRKQHIFFHKQKMKVKLATQLLSQSVADALKCCKNILCIEEFSEVDATIKFIEIFNAGFDILNSRSSNCIGNKKAVCEENIKQISEFTSSITNYIQGLKVYENNNFIPILESNRKMGFIGFIVCLNSLKHLYSSLIATAKLDHLKMYKISQDHLELFFGSVRSLGGYNNNPTARQFQSAYKKLVVRINDIPSFNTGNCIPLEHIDILHYSSSDPVKVINRTSSNINSDLIDFEENVQESATYNDHDYIETQNTYTFNLFSQEIIIYIAGFVVRKLTLILKCETCLKSLFSPDKDLFLNSFISLKNKGGNRGGLIYPSDDVITICLQTEKVLRSFNYKNKSVNALFVQSKVLSHFLHNTNIFSSLNIHRKESYSPLSDHVTLLIKSISTTYIKIKINHSLKALNEKPSLRMWYNKLTLFQGQ